MNRQEYYNRVKKTRNKTITDRTSKDEDYQILCQINYLSKQYIETLENALDEIEEILKQPMSNEFALCKALDEIEIIVNKTKGNE